MGDKLFSPSTQRVIDAISAVADTRRNASDDSVAMESMSGLRLDDGTPMLPAWTSARPYLGVSYLEVPVKRTAIDNKPLSTFSTAVQESLLLDDLLNAMLGFEGRYIRCSHSASSGVPGLMHVTFRVDSSADPSWTDLVDRMLPLCDQYVAVRSFLSLRCGYEHGMVNQALCAATSELLHDYVVLITQLEQQIKEGRLTLQRMWYHVQPALRTMRILESVCVDAASQDSRGGALLNLLLRTASSMAGDAASAQLFEYLVSRASAPFLRMLEAWIYRGAIEDPYSEFLVAENKALTKQSLMEDYSDEYWTERYALRDASCPRFLESHATKILTTGKYINAVRECDGTRDLRCPMSSTPLSYTADERVYGAKIDAAFQWASKTLMDVLLVSESLLGRLASLKHYFLIDEGDWFVHFMDASAEELSKPVGELSRTKLESLLELSIRTSICNADTYKEDVSVVLLREPLAHQLTKIFMAARPGLQVPKMPTTNPNLLSGLEAFALDYKVKWPLSLVVNRRAMAKYQLLFRHLFNCKHVERQLSGTWAQQQVLKEYRVHHLLQRVYSLRQRMLHFLQNYEYYMMVEVLEPAWHSMAQKIRSSGSATSSASSGLSGASPAADADAVLTIDDVMRLHNDFLDTCLKACLLTNIHLINRLSKILRVCLVYSKNMDAFFRDLISDTLGAEKPRGDKKVAAHARERSERIDVSSAVMRASLDDEAFTATIARLENDYTNHLRDLLETLGAHSHSSAGESHLSHLITRLDYNGFYKSSMRS